MHTHSGKRLAQNPVIPTDYTDCDQFTIAENSVMTTDLLKSFTDLPRERGGRGVGVGSDFQPPDPLGLHTCSSTAQVSALHPWAGRQGAEMGHPPGNLSRGMRSDATAATSLSSPPPVHTSGPTIPIDAALLDRAEELASLGLSVRDICRGLNVSQSWLYTHLRAARNGTGTPEDQQLMQRILRGQQQGTQRLVESLRQMAMAGDVKAATWLLSHSPVSRRDWSDVGAVLAEKRRMIGTMVEAIAACNLPKETEYRILLQCEAMGLGEMKPCGEDIEDVLEDAEEKRGIAPAEPPPAPLQSASKPPAVVVTPPISCED